MMNIKIFAYLGIVCLTALTGCTATSPANENNIASADVTSSEVSLTLDSDRSKDTAYRDYLKEQIEKSISSIDGITCCSVVLTIDDNNTVTAVSLDYTYDKDVYSGSSLNDLEESFEKYIKGSFETVETVTINGAEENTYDSESSNETSSNVNDLIYYGKSSIQADKGSNIIIRVAELDDYDGIKSINVYNCQTKQEVQLPVASEVKYTAEDDASYYIYAINSKGESLDLSKSISIEHAYTTDNAFIMD